MIKKSKKIKQFYLINFRIWTLAKKKKMIVPMTVNKKIKFKIIKNKNKQKTKKNYKSSQNKKKLQ